MHKIANKSKKPIALLSSAAIGVLIAAAVSTNAQAAVKSYVVKNGDKYISFDATTLLEDYQNKLINQPSPEYDSYLDALATEPGLVAFEDDVKGYVSATSVEKAYEDALAVGNNTFDIDNFTENAAPADILTNVNVGYEWKDGGVVPVEKPVAVSSVSAINATDVTVKLADGFDATKAADANNYAIAINGAAAVKPTAVTVTGSTAKLSIALAGQEGTLTVNGVAGNATAGTDKFDFKKPTITSVQALDAKTIVVNYSEKVDSATNFVTDPHSALNPANYTLYSVQTGTATQLNDAPIVATAAFTDATQTSVKLTLNITANTPGYPMQGLSNGNYMLYVTGTNDIATNTIIPNSNVTFAGTTTPNTTAPALVSSTFNNASGVVTLTFDKPTTGVAPADDKVSFQVGSNTVLLKNATDFTGISDGSTVSFTVASATLAKINALGANPQIVLADSAFTDGTNATVAATSTPTIVAGPVLNSVTYDENTNTVVYKFSKTIDVTKITAFDHNFVLGGVDIVGAKFNNTANGTDLSFTLADANAQAVETALRGGTLTASVVANTVQDTDATPNKNAAASSSATLVAGTTYTKDTAAPNLVGAKYYADSTVLALTFDKAIRNDVNDLSAADIELFKDNNGTAGLQTTDSGSVLADSRVTDLTGIENRDLYTDASAGTPATVDSESNTIYVKVPTAAATAISGVAAGTDIYVNAAASAVKDANTNTNTNAISSKLTQVAVSNTSTITDSNTTVTAANNGVINVAFGNGTGAVAVDPTTATNPANYNLYLGTNPLAKSEISSITMNADNTVATLLLKNPLTPTSVYDLTTSGIKTLSGAVADIDGTIIPAKTITAEANEAGTVLTTTGNPTLTDTDKSGTVTAGDKIAIVFNEPIKLPAGFDASSLTVSGGHSLGTSTVALSADAKTLTITVGSGATIAANDTITLPLTITNYENTALDTTNQTTDGLEVAGNVAPKIASVVYSDTNADGVVGTGDTLTVKFNQNIKAPDVANIKNDIKVGAATFSAATINGDTLTLTIATPDTIAVGAIADVDTTDTTPANGTLDNVDITNVWGTQAASNETLITKADATAPTVTGLGYNSTTHELTVNFSEAVNLGDADSDPDAANAIAQAIQSKLAVVSGSLGADNSATAATLSADGKSVTITLTGEALDQYSTVTVSAGSFADIKDASLNQAVRGQAAAYPITITQ